MTMQNNSILSHLVPNTDEAEQKYIGYLLSSLAEVYLIPISNYSNFTNRTIVESLLELQEKNLKIDYDSLLLLCKKKSDLFDSGTLYKIYNQPKNFENIELFKSEINEGAIKRNTLLQLENLLIATTNKKFFDINNFQNLLQKLIETSYSLSDNELLNGNILLSNYKELQEKRKNGILLRSLGYESLHKIINKPGAPEEITALVAQKGAGKSAFAKNIEQKLISKGICVVSINLEMSEESCMDRFQCLKTGFPLSLILSKENNPREQAQIDRAAESWKNINNYLFYKESSLSLNQLDGLIFKSKQIFKNAGILPKDEYCFITIDLLDMVEEFSIAKTTYEIKTAMNKLHQIIRKHKVHALLLLQANENKLRNGKIFKNPSDLDYYKVGMEDIEGSSVFAQRCRVVITLTRSLQMKKRFFPEQNELWDLETDIINCNIVKQNEGFEGFCQFVMGNNFRIYPFIKEEKELHA
jgi:replicative DNA helicase